MSGRGSEWRIWDLHVHTPASIKQHYGPNDEETWERFVSDLEALNPDISVIGVNDYLFLDGYKRLLDYKKKGRLPNIQLLLPVIELRLSHFGGTKSDWSRVNLHVIFDPELTPENIEAFFLTALRRCYTLSPEAQLRNITWDSFPTRETLKELGERIIASVPEDRRHEFESPIVEGFKNLNVSWDQVLHVLQEHHLKSRHLLAIGKAEWADVKWTESTIAEKKNIINRASFVFTAAQDPDSALRAKKALQREEVLSSLLDCSDAHNFSFSKDKDRIGNCFTWIKAQPTFRGLKYAAIEYESRVFIGERPPIFARVAAKPNAYIDRIRISSKEACPPGKRWLDVDIKLNPELCCIIGNKGSGKSAIADAIGLAANAHNESDFSFLNPSRFRRKPENLAQHFEVQLVWKSGKTSLRNLADSTDKAQPEEVRYLPQSYLERLCNEPPGGGPSQFETELKRIIFLNLPAPERAGYASLDELIAERKAQYEIRIEAVRDVLRELNRRIASLERLEVPAHRAAIDKKIKECEEQLAAHEQACPEEVPRPEEDPNVRATNGALLERLSSLERRLADLVEDKSRLELRKAALSNELTRLRRALTRVLEFEKGFERFLEQLASDLAGLLDEEGLREIVELRVNDKKIRLLISERERELSDVAHVLEDRAEGSLVGEITCVSEEIEQLRNQLSAPQRAYAKYREDHAAWSRERERIIGDAETAGSLMWLRVLRERAENAPKLLKELYEQRRAHVKELAQIVDEFRRELETLYSSAAIKLRDCEGLGESVPIEFEVRTVESGFSERFLEFIHLGARSTFQGVENANAILREMLAKVAFGAPDAVADFVEDVLAKLRSIEESSSGEWRRVDVDSVLRKSFTPAEVYNYVSGLEYLRPSFRLKFEGRDLTLLSPGQRGMVLLLFYLLVDAEDIPLVVDQPEENLDNQTVATYLVKAFRRARERRQVVVITHNSNLAVVCDADQIIRAHRSTLDGPFSYDVGALEGESICRGVIDILEGTEVAFSRRSIKYAQ